MFAQDIVALLSRGASEAHREVAALKQQQMTLKLEAGRLTRCGHCVVQGHASPCWENGLMPLDYRTYAQHVQLEYILWLAGRDMCPVVLLQG